MQAGQRPNVVIEQPGRVDFGHPTTHWIDRGVSAMQAGSTAVIVFCFFIGFFSKGFIRRIVDKQVELCDKQINALEKLSQVSEAALKHYEATEEFNNSVGTALISIKLGIDSANTKLDKIN